MDDCRAATCRKVEEAIEAARRPTHPGFDPVVAGEHVRTMPATEGSRRVPLLKRMGVRVATWWKMAWSFMAAHALGFVDEQTRSDRRTHCDTCGDRVVVHAHAHCHGANGGLGCLCPEGRWWPFSKLTWLTGLRNRACPRGKFSRAWPSPTGWMWFLFLISALAVAGVWVARSTC